ncbi:DUF6672 family protein [Fusobacterium russii]|uniref:DUF6672 family protein n=1 Tax=Fusobacterium russii TaxID=854 RepID=UPI0003A6FD2E|nr:DUF6672 family protein [Fusobacterium russii]
MNKIAKILTIVLILFVISVLLFITGKRHDILIDNNTTNPVKYSVNGEDYKVLDAKKKIKVFSKGLSNVIYLKTIDNKVIEKDLPSKDINVFVNEMVKDSDNWYEVIEIVNN